MSGSVSVAKGWHAENTKSSFAVYLAFSLITGRLPWQPAGITFTQCAKNQHFRPCRKNYALDRKMIDAF